MAEGLITDSRHRRISGQHPEPAFAFDRMIRIGSAAALLLCVCAGSAFAQGRYLVGQVTYVDKTDRERPAVDVAVAIKQTGDRDMTKENGLFRIFLRDSYKPGADVTIQVSAGDWLIWHPAAGEARVPADPGKIVEIKLLQRTDYRLKTGDQIRKEIEVKVKEVTEQVRQEGERTALKLDFSIWAERRGMTPREAQEEVDKWVAEVRKKDDLRERGLAEFAQGNLRGAYALATEAAREKKRRLDELKQRELELTRNVVHDYLLAGNAAYCNYDFRSALDAYSLALGETDPEAMPGLWAEAKVLVGNAAQQLGTRAAAAWAKPLLDESIASYRDALKVYTRTDSAPLWATTQSYIGNALQELGKRTPGAPGQRLLDEAVAAYRQALTIHTPSYQPRNWAMTQNSLSAVQVELAGHSTGEPAQALLGEAVNGYRAALKVRTRHATPEDWAATQHNLGIALRQLGTMTESSSAQGLLDESLAAFRAALQVRTRRDAPQDWAMTQNSLGIALEELGVRTEGEAALRRLEQAVAAYRSALEIYTPRTLPQDWARVQNNLGIALQEIGKRDRGEITRGSLREAISAYRAALEVYTRADAPQQWAEVQANLASALEDQTADISGAEAQHLRGEAVAAYRGALEVFTGEGKAAHRLKIQDALMRIAAEQQDWEAVAQTAREMLHDNPDDSDAFSTAAHVLQSKLHRFDDACALTEAWLERHRADLSVRANLVECHVTTGRFGDAACMVGELLATDALEPKTQVALRALRVIALAGVGDGGQASSELQLLKQMIQAQPASFRLTWDFAGIVYFVNNASAFSSSRIQLARLFEALEAPDRDRILTALGEIDVSSLAQ